MVGPNGSQWRDEDKTFLWELRDCLPVAFVRMNDDTEEGIKSIFEHMDRTYVGAVKEYAERYSREGLDQRKKLYRDVFGIGVSDEPTLNALQTDMTGLFTRKAQEIAQLTRHKLPTEIIEGSLAISYTSNVEESSLAEALKALPLVYWDVLQHKGVRIVVMPLTEMEAASAYSLRMIVIAERAMRNQNPFLLKRILTEEAIHYADKMINFTNTPEWQRLTEKIFEPGQWSPASLLRLIDQMDKFSGKMPLSEQQGYGQKVELLPNAILLRESLPLLLAHNPSLADQYAGLGKGTDAIMKSLSPDGVPDIIRQIQKFERSVVAACRPVHAPGPSRPPGGMTPS